jgi:hypothetical protein
VEADLHAEKKTEKNKMRVNHTKESR